MAGAHFAGAQGKETYMISTAMAVYNGAPYLREQLDSILAQTRPVDEIVAVDDGSKDDSWQILQEYAAKYPQFRLYKNEHNLGYKRNFQKALSLCHGDITFLCDQDDKWKPEKVEVMVHILETNSNISVLASSFQFMDKDSAPYEVELMRGRSNNNLYLKKVAEGDLVPVTFEEFLSHNYFQGCALAVKKNIRLAFVEKYNGLLPHDWFLNMLASKENGFCFLNERLFYYRMHAGNTVGVPQKGEHLDWVRLQFVQDTENVYETLRQVWPDYWHSHPECKQLQDFCHTHLQTLKNKDRLALLKENFRPVYWRLKPLKSHIGDILYVFSTNRR